MNKKIAAGLLSAAFLCVVPVIAGCEEGAGEVQTVENTLAFAGFESSDMTGYDGLKNYTRELKFVDITMDDVDKAMKAGESFVLYCGYKDCPWCNSIISIINDVAIEYGTDIGYLNTRRDPSWSSNLDMEGYDTFTKYFGDYLELDDDGVKHLYVPHIFFVKDGNVVSEHSGTAKGHENASDPLTQEQKDELTETLREGFSAVTGI